MRGPERRDRQPLGTPRRTGAEGATANQHCDTEVLLHLYLRDGPYFVTQLRGMFAIALWDQRERRLLLARDRFGIKPLYSSSRRAQLPSPPN